MQDAAITPPVYFSLSRNNTVIKTIIERITPYDLYGGSATRANAHYYTAGSYTLTAIAGQTTITRNFTVQ